MIEIEPSPTITAIVGDQYAAQGGAFVDPSHSTTAPLTAESVASTVENMLEDQVRRDGFVSVPRFEPVRDPLPQRGFLDRLFGPDRGQYTQWSRETRKPRDGDRPTGSPDPVVAKTGRAAWQVISKHEADAAAATESVMRIVYCGWCWWMRPAGGDEATCPRCGLGTRFSEMLVAATSEEDGKLARGVT